MHENTEVIQPKITNFAAVHQCIEDSHHVLVLLSPQLVQVATDVVQKANVSKTHSLHLNAHWLRVGVASDRFKQRSLFLLQPQLLKLDGLLDFVQILLNLLGDVAVPIDILGEEHKMTHKILGKLLIFVGTDKQLQDPLLTIVCIFLNVLFACFDCQLTFGLPILVVLQSQQSCVQFLFIFSNELLSFWAGDTFEDLQAILRSTIFIIRLFECFPEGRGISFSLFQNELYFGREKLLIHYNITIGKLITIFIK